MRKSFLPEPTRGFTLIELVAVIVILGVLAAVAVPAFLDLRRDALDQSMKAYGAALRAGVDNARMAWRVRGTGAAVTDLAGWHDGTADFDASGWLLGTGYTGGALTHERCAEIWRAALAAPPLIVAYTGVHAPGPRFQAYYQPGSGCLFLPLDAAGQWTPYYGTAMYAYVLYDPLDEYGSTWGTGAGYVFSVDTSGTFTGWRAGD